MKINKIYIIFKQNNNELREIEIEYIIKRYNRDNNNNENR